MPRATGEQESHTDFCKDATTPERAGSGARGGERESHKDSATSALCTAGFTRPTMDFGDCLRSGFSLPCVLKTGIDCDFLNAEAWDWGFICQGAAAAHAVGYGGCVKLGND